MIRNLYILVFFFVFVFGKAQFPNPMDFNTATNATNTGTIPVLANDLHWTASTTGIGGPYVPAVSCGNQAPGNWVNSPFVNANWITYPHTCVPGNPADHTCVGNIDEYYKLTFNLPATACGQSVSTPSAYCLSLDCYADNWIWEVFVNGVSAVTNPTATPYWSYGFWPAGKLSVTLCNNWQVGTNNVIFHVMSGGPYNPNITGFLAQANQTINTTVGIPLSATGTQTNVQCFGGSNGSASVSVTGGNGTYSYSWLPSGGNSNAATNLAAGNYTVMITSGSCVQTQTFNITQPGPVNLSVSPSATICQGSSTTFTVSGANSFLWNTGATSTVIPVNTAGIYSVTGITSGCSSTQTVSLSVAPLPVISVSGNTIVCPGESTNLTANGASTYTWNPGSLNGASVTVSPAASTIYSVTGKNTGCASSATIQINVSAITVTSSPSVSICTGSSATLNANGASTYTWNPGSLNGAQVVVTPTATTTYSVVGSAGTCTSSSTSLVVANPTISVNALATPSSVCPGGTSQLSANGAQTYTWYPGISTGSVISVSLSSATSYTVTGEAGGCFASGVITVNILPAPNVTAAYSGSVCEGGRIQLFGNGTNGFGYQWTGPFGFSSTDQNPSFNTSLNSNGIYFVTLVDSSGNGCVASASVSVYIEPKPVADFNYSPYEPTEGDEVVFTDASYNSITEWNWFFQNTAQYTSIIQNPTFTYEDAGTYPIVLVVKNRAGCLDTLIRAINVMEDYAFYIPDAFTPNNDGVNDVFGPKGRGIKKYQISIFDRWGEKLFETTEFSKGWDGTYKGKSCASDVYTYKVTLTNISNKSFEFAGHVTLIK